MALYSVRYPRDRVVDAVNLFSNPSFETSLNRWDGSYYGPNTAGTFSRAQANWAKFGSYYAVKKWTGATSSNVTGAGFTYEAMATSPGWTYEVEGFMACPQGAQGVWATAQWLDGNGSQLSVSFGQRVAMTANAWTSVRGSFTAPAGAASVRFGFACSDGGRFQNDELWLDMCSCYSGAFVGYMDGTLAPTSTYVYQWAGAAHDSNTQRTIDNPATRVLPDMVLGYDTARQSLNTVHQFLSGNVGATQRPSSLRSGTLKLFFTDPAKAAVAESVHAGAGFFQFADDANPAEFMNYVVDGLVRSYQDSSRLRRILEVPYREITV